MELYQKTQLDMLFKAGSLVSAEVKPERQGDKEGWILVFVTHSQALFSVRRQRGDVASPRLFRSVNGAVSMAQSIGFDRVTVLCATL